VKVNLAAIGNSSRGALFAVIAASPPKLPLSAIGKTQKHSTLSQRSLQTLEESQFGDSNHHLWNSCCFFATQR
jgi:hypothetical protein